MLCISLRPLLSDSSDSEGGVGKRVLKPHIILLSMNTRVTSSLSRL
jgi:hypothetical protein